MLNAARHEVERAAHRFDAAVSSVELQSDGLRASVRRATPMLVVGGGIALGLALILLPRRVRSTALLGAVPLLMRHLWPASDIRRSP